MRRRSQGVLSSSLVVAGLGLALSGSALADAPAVVDDTTVAHAGSVNDVGGQTAGQTEEIVNTEAEENEYKAAWAEYGKNVGNRYMVGLNSLITFPADPVMDTVKPREEFDELPLAAGTKYVAGFFTGTMLSMYRAGMGAFDVLMAPITPMKMLSPEPRWMLFPAEHEEL